jgi:hypothetical protein
MAAHSSSCPKEKRRRQWPRFLRGSQTEKSKILAASFDKTEVSIPGAEDDPSVELANSDIWVDDSAHDEEDDLVRDHISPRKEKGHTEDICPLSPELLVESSVLEPIIDHYSSGEEHELERNHARIHQPMMARMDALRIQQELYGMDHPDVLFSLKQLGRAHPDVLFSLKRLGRAHPDVFSLKPLGRAHQRRGEFQELVRAGYNSRNNDGAAFHKWY